MEPVTPQYLEEFLNRLGDLYHYPLNLYLLGGSALLMLGNLRQTLDIDFTTDQIPQQEESLHSIMSQLADQFHFEIESVPISEFVPLPPGAEQRRRFIGRYGQIDVYVYDLYTIALSKIARGFDSDLEDVVFLIKSNFIELTELVKYFYIVLPMAAQSDINPTEFKKYLQELIRRLSEN